jgi:hypothetical protein
MNPHAAVTPRPRSHPTVFDVITLAAMVGKSRQAIFIPPTGTQLALSFFLLHFTLERIAR